jgi:AAA domain, putative AbiEii toxin, Type IV TA system
MLNRIHIQNYKCLRDITVALGDFTILIGPNDSGKSSFLEAIQAFGKILQLGYPAVFHGDRSVGNLVWGKDPGLHIGLEVAGTTSGHRFVYRLELPAAKRPPSESLELDGEMSFRTEEIRTGQTQPQTDSSPVRPVAVTAQGRGTQQTLVAPGKTILHALAQQRKAPFDDIADALKSSAEYRFDLQKLPRSSVPKPGVALTPSGDNLAAVLDVMQNSPDRSGFEALQDALRDAIPTLRGIVLPPATSTDPPGAKALEFILSRSGQLPVTIPGSLASGGALLLTAYFALAYAQTPGLLLIEEPENGLHPSRLQMVLDLLRRMSRGEVGNRKRQIVLTTHNPLLLNYASPEEVRVFVRHPEQGTKVIPMTEAPEIDRLLKEFALGELWYLLGEEKLFQEPKRQAGASPQAAFGEDHATEAPRALDRIP